MNHNFEPINIPEMRDEVQRIKGILSNESISQDDKFEQAFAVVRKMTGISDTLSATLERWNQQIAESNLVYSRMPPSVLDYIDALIVAGKVKNAKEIVALFESGELKGIITPDNNIDKDALTAFETKQTKPKQAKKTKVKSAKAQEANPSTIPDQPQSKTEPKPNPPVQPVPQIEEEDLF